MAAEGVRVIFADALPDGSSTFAVKIPAALLGCEAMPANDVADALIKGGFRFAAPDSFEPDLKLYPYSKNGKVFLVLFNENIHSAVDVALTAPGRYAVLYDPYAGVQSQVPWDAVGDQLRARVHLEPYALWVLANVPMEACAPAEPPTREKSIRGDRVSTATAKEFPTFTERLDITGSGNLNRADGLPRFSGTIRYEGSFDADEGERLLLDLGEVGETAEVWVNGRQVGVAISPPYVFDITHFAAAGETACRLMCQHNGLPHARWVFGIPRNRSQRTDRPGASVWRAMKGEERSPGYLRITAQGRRKKLVPGDGRSAERPTSASSRALGRWQDCFFRTWRSYSSERRAFCVFFLSI